VGAYQGSTGRLSSLPGTGLLGLAGAGGGGRGGAVGERLGLAQALSGAPVCPPPSSWPCARCACSASPRARPPPFARAHALAYLDDDDISTRGRRVPQSRSCRRVRPLPLPPPPTPPPTNGVTFPRSSSGTPGAGNGMGMGVGAGGAYQWPSAPALQSSGRSASVRQLLPTKLPSLGPFNRSLSGAASSTYSTIQ